MSDPTHVTRTYCSHAKDGISQPLNGPAPRSRAAPIPAGQLWLICAVLWVAVVNASAQSVETHSFTALNRLLPDGNPAGFSDRRAVTSSIVNISKVRVKLQLSGEFNGDVYGYLR